MKNILAIASLLILLTACAADENEGVVPCDGVEKWRLVKMTGNFANFPPTTGDDMEWQELIVFQPNGNFTKTRQRNGQTTVATGTFAGVKSNDDQFVELRYSSDNELIASCVAGLTEMLWIQPDQLVGTWSACDGPGLYYEKQECGCSCLR